MSKLTKLNNYYNPLIALNQQKKLKKFLNNKIIKSKKNNKTIQKLLDKLQMNKLMKLNNYYNPVSLLNKLQMNKQFN